jgi:hypothetical protein
MSSVTRKSRKRTTAAASFRWIGIGDLAALVVPGGAVLLLATHWPFTRNAINKTLQETFSSQVEMRTFKATYFTAGCIAEGVTFRRNNDRTVPPIATIEKLSIEAGYPGMFTFPKRIRRVRIEGLRMFVSPGSERTGGTTQSSGSSKPSTLIIGEIVADGAVVEFAGGESGTEPLKFEIHELTLHSVSQDRALSFHAELLNPTPPGEIRADGQFGPLQRQNAGYTLLAGSYTFARADLGVFPGLSGTLSSAGKFNGTLERIELKDAVATFTNLSFSIPGALARVHGTCALLTEKIDLHGSLQVDSKLSKGSKGVKKVLFKPIEPFLRKKNAGEIVPIKIAGTFSHPDLWPGPGAVSKPATAAGGQDTSADQKAG